MTLASIYQYEIVVSLRKSHVIINLVDNEVGLPKKKVAVSPFVNEGLVS